MEMEVAVEKNQRVKAFGFSPPQSRESEDDLLSPGQGPAPPRSPALERKSPAKALPHKLPPMLKIAVIGDSTAGKTVICEAFCRKNFTPASKYSMTCGVQIYGKCISASALEAHEGKEEKGRESSGKAEEKVNLILLDSAGKDLYREYLPKYWEKLDAVMVVIDLTSPTALESAAAWMDTVEPAVTSTFATQSKRVGVLVGNKTDLKDQRLLSRDAAAEFAEQHNLEYFECSVRNNAGFEEPFYFLARQWFELQQKRPGRGASSHFRGQGPPDKVKEPRSAGVF